MKISNYDEYEYDYETYWNTRAYEDNAEKIFLKKVFKKLSGSWFIDIGGSYGRNTSLYYEKFHHSVILDYSLNTLQSRYEKIKKRYPNTFLVAANAYKMPFKDQTFDGGLMVRVLHHLDQSDQYFKELGRIMDGESTYIQEFANKIHIKSALKHLLKFDLSFFRTDPYQQPNLGNFEGSKGESTTFLNYHPNDIEKKLNKNKFEVIKKQGVSYFRIPFVKRVVPIQILNALESVSQFIFRGLPITPSMFFVSRKDGDISESSTSDIYDILCCPKCKAELEFKGDKAKCNTCESTYLKKGDIWDLRVE